MFILNTRQPNPVHIQQLPEHCYELTVRHPLMVVGTADRNLVVFNLQNPQVIAIIYLMMKCQFKVISWSIKQLAVAHLSQWLGHSSHMLYSLNHLVAIICWLLFSFCSLSVYIQTTHSIYTLSPYIWISYINIYWCYRLS